MTALDANSAHPAEICTRTDTLALNREAFDLCARTNLTHAAKILDNLAEAAAHGGKLLAGANHSNAAATIRELLALENGAYFTPRA